jgi:hypothetical protein
MQINLLFSSEQAIAVVPLPEKQSKTKSFSLLETFIKYSNIANGFCVL